MNFKLWLYYNWNNYFSELVFRLLVYHFTSSNHHWLSIKIKNSFRNNSSIVIDIPIGSFVEVVFDTDIYLQMYIMKRLTCCKIWNRYREEKRNSSYNRENSKHTTTMVLNVKVIIIIINGEISHYFADAAIHIICKHALS